MNPLKSGSALRLRRLAWGAAIVLTLLGTAWFLSPRFHTASEDEVREHIASRWLEPLSHPPGGRERYVALHQGLEALTSGSQVRPPAPLPLDLADPAVAAVVEIVRRGPLDPTDQPDLRLSRLRVLTSGLADAALKRARSGDWVGVERQMNAAFLVLDRLLQCSQTIPDRGVTLNMEADLHAAVVQLAARGDLPEQLAGQLAAMVMADRHRPEDIERVLRGEMQLHWVGALATFRDQDSGDPLMWVAAGNYDPLETAELFSQLLDEIAGNAALPVSRWSHDVATRFEPIMPYRPFRRASLREQVQWPWIRLRMATTHNSIGRYLIANSPLPRAILEPMLHAQTARDKAAAALAVRRFAARTGRDPVGFEELIAAGLLDAAPVFHVIDRPLPFNLASLLFSARIRN